MHNVESFKKENVVPDNELSESKSSPTKTSRGDGSKNSRGFDKLTAGLSPLKGKKERLVVSPG